MKKIRAKGGRMLFAAVFILIFAGGAALLRGADKDGGGAREISMPPNIIDGGAYVIAGNGQPKDEYVFAVQGIGSYGGLTAGMIDTMAKKALAAIEKKTGIKIRLVYYDSWEGLKKAFESGEADFTFEYDNWYINSYGGLATAIATYSIDGDKTHSYCIYVKKDGPIKTVADLRGRGMPGADMHFLKQILIDNGIDEPLDGFFGYMPFNYGEELAALESGDLDYFIQATDYMLVLQFLNSAYKDTTRVLACTEKFTNHPLVARNGVPRDVIARVVSTLADAYDDPEFAGVFSMFEFYGVKVKVVPVSDSDYDAWRAFDKKVEDEKWDEKLMDEYGRLSEKSQEMRFRKLESKVALDQYDVKSVKELADMYINGMQCPQAIELLKKYLAGPAPEPEARTLMARALMCIGKYPEAIESAEQGIAAGDKSAEVHALIGEANERMGRLKEAEAAYLEAEKLAGPDDNVQSQILYFYYQRLGDLDKAEKKARSLLQSDYNRSWTLETLAEILVRKGSADEQEVLQLLESSYKLRQEKYPEALAMAHIGRLLREYGDDELKADEYFRKAVEAAPDCIKCYTEGWWGLRDPAVAIERCLKAIEIDPSNEDGYYCLADKYYEMKKYREVIEITEKALEHRRGSRQTVDNEAILSYFKLGERDTALKLLEKQTEAKQGAGGGDESSIAETKISILMQAGEFRLAEEEYRKYAEKLPFGSRAEWTMAARYGRWGRFEEAVEMLERAVVKDPDCATCYTWIAGYEANLERWDEAEKAAVKALELAPRSVYIMQILGEIYLAQGKFKDAEKQFRAALEIEPRNPKAKERLALAEKGVPGTGADGSALDVPWFCGATPPGGDVPLAIGEVHTYPNPFRGGTDAGGISFAAQNIKGAEDIYISAEIYDIRGKLVTKLSNVVFNYGVNDYSSVFKNNGYALLEWNPPANASGAPVASGVYLYTLKATTCMYKTEYKGKISIVR